MVLSTPGFSVPHWLFRRFLPYVLIVAVATIIAGFTRGFILFVPGIMGMAVGGVVGWIAGRIGRSDPETVWTFSLRVGLTLGAALFFGIGTAAVVSIINTGTMGLPLDWLAGVVAGTEGEYFFGSSRNSFQNVEGVLTGVWWFVFSFVDVLLFSLLFLVTLGVGLSPDDETEDGQFEDDGECPELPPPLPMEPGRTVPPLGLITFALFAVLGFGSLVGLAMWPSLGVLADAEDSGSRLLSELQGDWTFGEEAAFLGKTEAERSFTLQRGLGTELVGFAAVPTHFMLSMEMRRDGVFEGRFNLGGRGLFSLRMRPSDDRSELAFSVDLWSPDGRTEKSLTARRVETIE